MHINKPVAFKEQEFLGKLTNVIEYHDDRNIKKINILLVENSLGEGVKACATIGLNKTDLGMSVEDKRLRVELLAAAYQNDNNLCQNILSTTAFEVMDRGECKPEYIAKNIVSMYKKDTDMKHVLLVDPFLWEDIGTLDIEGLIITWLLVVPISQAELDYSTENGTDALLDLFEEKQIDIYDINRKSVL